MKPPSSAKSSSFDVVSVRAVGNGESRQSGFPICRRQLDYRRDACVVASHLDGVKRTTEVPLSLSDPRC